MKIPIQNIYFLLCYAWDVLKEGGVVHVRQDERRSYADLFARVLITGVTHLLKRGLDRGYVTNEEDTNNIRGKVDVAATIKHNCLRHARVHCLYDDLSYDVLHNRVIKATTGRLVSCVELDAELRNRLVGIHRRLHDITPIYLSAGVFGRVVLHRNNAFYGFLLNVCRLIYDCLLIDEETGKITFRDFLRDEVRMRMLFERFVFNFYRREQSRFEIKRERICWGDVDASDENLRFLPTMNTDVSLISGDRHIILDTKYSANALQTSYSSEKIRSEHLYQLFTYLKNLQVAIEDDRKVEGILLYPTVSRTLELEYIVQGHRIRVVTVDLNSHWSQIRERLLAIIN
jgi:5-methylcytosine-specific restriction enzyme subunit McrC